MNTIDYSIILLGTIIIYYSRSSLLRPQSYGFYRFFSWEIILVQFAINRVGWFRNAGSWNQLISWILLIGSIIFLILGIRSIRKFGQSVTYFEATTHLVRIGIFKYIRHPMYASLLLLTWGIFLKSPSWQDFLITISASIFLYATAQIEEKENIYKFGTAYLDYKKETKRFIPYIF
jgi:protein-S-isoprenylcysteine O-methyltransferase Ste14